MGLLNSPLFSFDGYDFNRTSVRIRAFLLAVIDVLDLLFKVLSTFAGKCQGRDGSAHHLQCLPR